MRAARGPDAAASALRSGVAEPVHAVDGSGLHRPPAVVSRRRPPRTTPMEAGQRARRRRPRDLAPRRRGSVDLERARPTRADGCRPTAWSAFRRATTRSSTARARSSRSPTSRTDGERNLRIDSTSRWITGRDAREGAGAVRDVAHRWAGAQRASRGAHLRRRPRSALDADDPRHAALARREGDLLRRRPERRHPSAPAAARVRRRARDREPHLHASRTSRSPLRAAAGSSST